MKELYSVCVIENSAEDLSTLTGALNRYGREHGCTFRIADFTNVESFLTGYKGTYDLIFFDIDLPGENGMEGAKQLRQIDTEVTILFVTNLAKYAIEGYQVKAYDYMLKPVVYERFAIKLSRVLGDLDRREKKFVLVKSVEGARKIDVDTIIYVEVMVHTLRYHLSDGSCVEVTGRLGALEEELSGCGFAKASRSYLVNMRYISGVKRNEVEMTNGERFTLSRNKGGEFKDRLMQYIAGGRRQG